MNRLFYWNGITKSQNLYGLVAISMAVAIPTVVLSLIDRNTVDAVLLAIVQVPWALCVVAIGRKVARRQVRTGAKELSVPTTLGHSLSSGW